MYVGDIIDNSAFPFYAPVRIVRNEGKKTITLFDSTISPDIMPDVMIQTVSAIYMDPDAVLRIEVK